MICGISINHIRNLDVTLNSSNAPQTDINHQLNAAYGSSLLLSNVPFRNTTF